MEERIEIAKDLVNRFKEASSLGAHEVVLFYRQNTDHLNKIEQLSEYYPFKLNVFFDYGKCLKHIGEYREAYYILTKTLYEYDSFYKEFKYYKNKYILSILDSIVSLCKVLGKTEKLKFYEEELTKRGEMTWMKFHTGRFLMKFRKTDIIDEEL